jgi:hypothetical protein
MTDHEFNLADRTIRLLTDEMDRLRVTRVELLEALEELMEAVGEVPAVDGESWTIIAAPTLRKARAAIARATGGPTP